MESIATTRLSSKGQVVIPEIIRNQLGLKEGAQFVVLGQKDVVILKAITPPSDQDFEELISAARGQARSAHLHKKDVIQAIKKVRKS
ncbi:MAG: AbrB/MazE/SpoVT family DNA-binding domain-containing protein [Deltaproteobacteria bacterium]|nr:AbrB/MazE/SpoVT family DNA-binding domain-containing protein [Deltaproteobacteria bacterium]